LKDVSDFDKISKKKATISIPEIIKLLKEHKIDQKELNRKEITELVHLVSTNLMGK
jgi:hypothetical protein